MNTYLFNFDLNKIKFRPNDVIPEDHYLFLSLYGIFLSVAKPTPNLGFW